MSFSESQHTSSRKPSHTSSNPQGLSFSSDLFLAYPLILPDPSLAPLSPSTVPLLFWTCMQSSMDISFLPILWRVPPAHFTILDTRSEYKMSDCGRCSPTDFVHWRSRSSDGGFSQGNFTWSGNSNQQHLNDSKSRGGKILQ